MVKPPDFQSGNCRFESCPDHQFKQTGSSVRQERVAHNREDGRSNRPRSTRSSVLGIVAVHPAFNRKRGVRFSQGGPFAAVAQAEQSATLRRSRSQVRILSAAPIPKIRVLPRFIAFSIWLLRCSIYFS